MSPSVQRTVCKWPPSDPPYSRRRDDPAGAEKLAEGLSSRKRRKDLSLISTNYKDQLIG